MAIIKCKMCGGDLEVKTGSTVAECEYCGSRQTVPTVDNEKKLTLFARANRLRFGCEFDKASVVYESIIADFPEEAEAYWGLVLCKYGIEYVDDPVTGKKIPTCHRSSFESILEDSDFEQSLENADVVARKVYREEAKYIEEIRKGIIEVSGKEPPYDIFICYKETDENGERTVDSVMAQDVYDALTEKGYRVFFSRITLENKLGQEYEPYIFAALNSAKIMLAFGTDYDYYNSVWVKNEWSRFLKLMVKDKTKHLIPCYKNIDAYDMPKEFVKLQAQDMGKVGAIQDLLRGIDKLLQKTKPEDKSAQEKSTFENVAYGKKVSSLLDRGFMALGDKEWDKADGFFEEVLNNDSRNVRAYLGKALAQEKQSTIDGLVNLWTCSYAWNPIPNKLYLEKDTKHIEDSVKGHTVLGYLRPKTIEEKYDFDLTYPSSVSQCKSKLEAIQRLWANNKCLEKMEKYASVEDSQIYANAKKSLFDFFEKKLQEAKNSEEEARQSLQHKYEEFLLNADKTVETLYVEAISKEKNNNQQKQAKEEEIERNIEDKNRIINEIKLKKKEEERKKDNIYQSLIAKVEKEKDVSKLKTLHSELLNLGVYKDNAKYAKKCRDKILAFENSSIRKKKLRVIFFTSIVFILFEILILISPVSFDLKVVLNILLFTSVLLIPRQIVSPCKYYKKALRLFKEDEYYDSYRAFSQLESFNSKELSQFAETYNRYEKYKEAVKLAEEGKKQKAIEAFTSLGDFLDSPNKIQEISFSLHEPDYNDALELIKEEKYCEAIAAFSSLGDYLDSAEQLQKAMFKENCRKYQKARQLLDEEDNFNEVAKAFFDLGDFLDSRDCLKNLLASNKKYVPYQNAYKLMEEGRFGDANKAFSDLGDFLDSKEQLQNNKNSSAYKIALQLEKEGKIGEAINSFSSLGDYLDSLKHLEILQERLYNSALAALSSGQRLNAIQCFSKIRTYKDSMLRFKEIIVNMNSQSISAGLSHTVGLKKDGTVVAIGYNDQGQCNVSNWRNIVSVCAGSEYTVGLKRDGTVTAVGYNGEGQCRVSSWKDIVSIRVGGRKTVGLKSDGTVIIAGEKNYDQVNVKNWKNIVSISAGLNHIVGLKEDGTVVAVGYELNGQCNVKTWKDIVSISAGLYHTVGLQKDGTVVAVGDNREGQCNVRGWRNIVAVSAGDDYTLGLKKDGTVVAVGSNIYGQCNISNWKDIVAINAGGETVGLKRDGTVIAIVFSIIDDTRTVTYWNDIKTPV